ncbi:MAG: KUP/HAK/KT family potassium transporter [Deltaproteobacteria bacterium]|nr:KUP/HAK/KT family potassium transporter [Deltaproteobacteria bacterium]
MSSETGPGAPSPADAEGIGLPGHDAPDSFAGGVIKSMGLVFGDIGTSPIYTFTVIFALLKPTPANIVGVASLILWTMTILVMVQYAWLAMSLSHKGEGGTIVLKEILVQICRSKRVCALVGALSILGVSLLLGDGVITPAISILSAVEGAVLIPGFEGLSQGVLIFVAALIAIGLFLFQKKGTDRVGKTFGPLMAVWFCALTASGLVSISGTPGILRAVSPLYGLAFVRDNGMAAFFVLSEVILCATGGEALYADMGHLGRRPILHAWGFVFPALVVNYLGQAAYLSRNPLTKNVLFEMVKSQIHVLYIPFLILTILATVVASQAMISGVYSIVYQGITTRLLPLMKVDYTSSHMKSQIYIGSINWSLMVAVLFIMLIFRRSENLAAAYGLAVTGTMAITGIMMILIFFLRGKKALMAVSIGVTAVDLLFLFSNINKIPHGGYWSLILASFPLVTILIWTNGQRQLYRSLMPLSWEAFIISYREIYDSCRRISGTALFFTRELRVIPPYIVHCMFRSNILYDRNVFISITRTEEPGGMESVLQPDLEPGLDGLEVKAGYMEVIDLEAMLREHGIKEKVIFYGVEDIATENFAWRIFSAIKKLTPNFVQFYKLPTMKLQGVVTRVEM